MSISLLHLVADGTPAVLGIWIEQNKTAKFWLRVMNKLHNREVEDMPVSYPAQEPLMHFPPTQQEGSACESVASLCAVWEGESHRT